MTPNVDTLAVMLPRSAGAKGECRMLMRWHSCRRAPLGSRVTPDTDALALMSPRSTGVKSDAGYRCAGAHV
ncbi:hypothetical protein yberc0001_36270, partial [Yersinia bercovieri ATCC 43970]